MLDTKGVMVFPFVRQDFDCVEADARGHPVRSSAEEAARPLPLHLRRSAVQRRQLCSVGIVGQDSASLGLGRRKDDATI